MSETQFTPGPWHNVDCDIYDNRSDDAPGIPLMRSERGNYRSWGRELSDAERQANAALIAASPELYSALENIAWATPEKTAFSAEELIEVLRATARAALAKATPTAL